MYIKFKQGSIKVEVIGNALYVGDEIVLDARTITFPKGSKVYYAEPTKKKMVIVIEHPPIRFVEDPPRVDLVANDRFYYMGFDVRATDLDFEKYLTVVVPGSFLYDYVIVTSNKSEVAMSAKRKAYLEETEKSSIIYLL
ncbi:hypothetical protein EYM_02185 [Ignicoccus islandicus DSM 13165]|uniref:Uncharacterized protein n=1 Tax=Ignicoccus islandicus DSM 13165 TaxID=940295 RepID=A0A0U3F8F3_9CREN|nr:hypothetical protein [Ignicoccus islandicus]ALU12296.1 hypothetical protein EYM_02185 [Ignicoccus islandicus DSM 13165]